MALLLPFEQTQRNILIRKESETNYKYGCNPENRKTHEIIDYGIVNIDKPKGPTSHQVSDYVQRILHINKSGHAGTLDPAVVGVLPVALGRGTRIVQALLTAGKEYVAIMHLHKEIEKKILQETIQQNFLGKIMQMPPLKSSVKRQLRQRTIYYFDILEFDGQDVLFKVGTEAGTYIRKLCLHPETEILTNIGLMTISNFYSNPYPVYSYLNGKTIQKCPISMQKIFSPPKLLKINMYSGINFIVTPDHEILKSTVSGYRMTEARLLRAGDYLVKSARIPIRNTTCIIPDLLDDKYLIMQPEIKQLCKAAFIKKYGSVRAMNRILGFDRKAFLSKSKNAITIAHLKAAGIYDEVKSKINTYKTEKGSIIHLQNLNTDFFYLLGLVASDGNNTKEKRTIRHTRIKFHNIEECLINEFLKKYKSIFPKIPISKKKITKNLFQLDTANSFFATIAASLGVRSPYIKTDLTPILYLNPDFIKAFLKGYFDGDGSAYFKEKNKIKGHYSNIRIYCCNYKNIKRIHQMLIKIDILNKIVSVKGFNNYKMYAVELLNITAKKKFIREIGSNHPRKKKYLQQILNSDNYQSDFDYYIGFHFKKFIKNSKKKLHKMGGNLHRILTFNVPCSRSFYEKCSKLTDLPKLDDFAIEKIVSIEEINGEGFVYDMTVPDAHNFMIETGYVSSNCHDLGQKLKVGAHMAELRRTKAGPFDESTLFTLQELTDAYYYWKEEHNEKFIRKVIQPIENGTRHLPKIWVFDTTVESLCHGTDLKVPGISKLNDKIKKEDFVAIMTLKNELIALGSAQIASEEMIGEKGLAVRTDKVFMKPGTYTIS